MGEMNESHRRRSSKWDLKDAPEFTHDSMQESMHVPFHEKTRESVSVREHASGSRGSRKDDYLNTDSKRWEEYGNYSTRMSPGLDEWRHKSRGHSPRSGAWRKPTRSRSRSRSPPRGTKRDIGMNDGSRSKSGLLTQPCKEFASGRCAKGSRCMFNHDDNQSYDHTRYPYDTRESSARGGKQPHHGSSDGYDRGRANEIVRERDDDRGTRDSSFEHGGERDPCRGRDILCKFFAAGNCRNGKHCRFSHSAHTSSSSEGRLRDGRWGINQDVDSTDPLKGSSRWKEKDTTLSRNVELDKGKHDIVVGQESMGTLSSRSASWDKNLDTRNGRYGSPRNERDTEKTIQWKMESSDHATDVSKYKGADEWMGDAMSPEWNPKVKSPNYMNKDRSSDIALRSQPPTVNELTYLPTSVKTLSREASGQLHHAVKTEILPNKFERSYTQHSDRMENVATYNNVNFSDVLSRQDFNQSGLNSMGLRSSSAVGHAQLALTAAAGEESLRNPPYQSAIQDERLMIKPDVVNANSLSAAAVPATQSMVNEEQQVQLNNLSASLSQLLAGKQLPQLYASLNNPKALELLPNALALISPTAPTSILPNLSVGHQKPYDPSPVGLGHDETRAHPTSNISNDYVEHRTVEDEKQEVHAGEQNGDKTFTAVHLKEIVNHENQLKQSDSVVNHPKKDSQILPNIKKTEDEIEETQEDIHAKDTEGEKEDGGKKTKDLKATRAFKFALVESVKELLKPTWKDGHINKDVYKNIVKKVADKVTGTLQVTHIPQTQEKIDQYLASSKPKLTKLVQAYVERHQKSQK